MSSGAEDASARAERWLADLRDAGRQMRALRGPDGDGSYQPWSPAAARRSELDRGLQESRRVLVAMGRAIGLPAQAVEAHCIEGLMWKEVASRLGVSIAAVYRLRAEAVRWLAAHLDDEG